MAIVVNTNTQSLQVQRNLNAATNAASTAMQRMTTGLKINVAGDDAAGLTIAKGLETQIRGSEVAQKNTQTGTNLLQTAEGTLDAIQNHLLRINDLVTESLNGGFSATELKAFGDEVDARVEEINRLQNVAKFNEFDLFDQSKTGGTSTMTFQVGHQSAAINTIDVKGVFEKASFSSLTGTTLATGAAVGAIVAATDTARAATATLLDDVQKGIEEVSARRGSIGVASMRMKAAAENLAVQNENLVASKSRIVDADIAKESSEYTRSNILQQASAALLVQANQAPSIALSLI